MPDDLELFDLLRRHGVDFVIVGGHAVNVHGYRRATEDIDIVWIRSPETECRERNQPFSALENRTD
jgi:hypothetical protein